MKALGKHLLVEFYQCDKRILDDKDKIAGILSEAVEISGATIIKPFFHQFSPQGVSGVVIIAESHFTIHTWPEYGYAAVDIFTCGEKINHKKAFDCLKKALCSSLSQIIEIKRGALDLPESAINHKPET